MADSNHSPLNLWEHLCHRASSKDYPRVHREYHQPGISVPLDSTWHMVYMRLPLLE